MMDSFRIGQRWFPWMGGEIRTDLSPVVAAVLALPNVLGAVIQVAWVLRRKNDRGRNCASKLRIVNRADDTHPKIDALRAPRPAIDFLQETQGAVREYDVRMGRVNRYEARFPAGQREPIKVGDLSHRAPAGDRKCAAILLAAIYPVGIPVISGNFVNLSCYLVIPGTPGATTIETDRCTLVAAVHNMARVSGINPPLIRVVTSGRPFESDQSVTAVGGSVNTGTHRIYDVRIMRIHQNLFARCINRLGGQRPARAPVVRPVKTCIVQQIHALEMSDGRDCSLSDYFGLVTTLQLYPGQALIGGPVQACWPRMLGEPARRSPRRNIGSCHRGENYTGIIARPGHVSRAGLGLRIQHQRPRSSSVGAAKHAARSPFTMIDSARGCEHQIRIVRVHQ